MKIQAYLFILLTFFILMPIAKANTINISELSLDEKIGQMVMARTEATSPQVLKLNLGGIFLFNQKSEAEYKSIIDYYKDNSKISPLVAADMEGYWNPFSSFYQSKTFGEINTPEEALSLGKEHADIMKRLGFNLDFSPVVEERNTVWPGRSFKGTHTKIKEKVKNYINGLQSNGIMATAKHYPGGSMLKDPHIWKVRYNLTIEDLDLFQTAIDNNVSAIMIGHPIISGVLDSKGKQATVSPEIISYLRQNFHGLIITDAINMLGLQWSYLFKYKQLYIDLVKAGNDIILDFSSPSLIKRRMDALKLEVKKGNIPEKRIDESVERILQAKGYEVKH